VVTLSFGRSREMTMAFAGDNTPQVQARPFLKWPGGKRQLLPYLLPILRDAGGGTYHEPFLGAGSVFFALRSEGLFPNACLSDVNQELIDAYEAIRDAVEDVIVHLRKHKARNSETYYYRVRDERPRSPHTIAARMIYLRKTCFNGLQRVNKSGKFNASWGFYENPNICDEPNLRAVSQVLSTTDLRVGSFETVPEHAVSGDVVYFDPPYVPVSSTASFTAYSADGFGPEHQIRLAAVVRELHRNSVRIVLSNSDCPEVRKLYTGFRIKQVLASRRINTRGDRRGPVPEVIVRNF
jgi:DNA adenine methylase